MYACMHVCCTASVCMSVLCVCALNTLPVFVHMLVKTNPALNDRGSVKFLCSNGGHGLSEDLGTVPRNFSLGFSFDSVGPCTNPE